MRKLSILYVFMLLGLLCPRAAHAARVEELCEVNGLGKG